MTENEWLIQGRSEFLKHNPNLIIRNSIQIADFYIAKINLDSLSNPVKVRNIIVSVTAIAIILHDLLMVPKIMASSDRVEESIKALLNQKLKFNHKFAEAEKYVKNFIQEQHVDILNSDFISVAVISFNKAKFYDSVLDAWALYEGSELNVKTK